MATEDREARTALSPAATHALVAVVLVVVVPASPVCTVVVVIWPYTSSLIFGYVACHARPVVRQFIGGTPRRADPQSP